MDEKAYIAALIAARKLRAEGAMQTQPQPGMIEYTYGREAGIQLGMRMAEGILTDMLKTEEEKDI